MHNARTHYAILGDGRLARHLRHYLELLGLPCSGWSRRADSPFNTHATSDAAMRLERTIAPASHVLLLVSDGAIAGLVDRHPALSSRKLVHCSGALDLDGVAAAHPLMTFGHGLYDLERYRQIPFVVEPGQRFSELLPGLPNPHFELERGDRARYHALCVMAGNFPQLLWQAVGHRFERELGLPAAALEPYLRQVLDNFLADPDRALTGPLSRGDHATVERNIYALSGDPLQKLYAAFANFHAEAAPAPVVEPRECAL